MIFEKISRGNAGSAHAGEFTCDARFQPRELIHRNKGPMMLKHHRAAPKGRSPRTESAKILSHDSRSRPERQGKRAMSPMQFRLQEIRLLRPAPYSTLPL